MICKYNKKARTKKIRAKLFLKYFVNRSNPHGGVTHLDVEHGDERG